MSCNISSLAIIPVNVWAQVALLESYRTTLPSYFKDAQKEHCPHILINKYNAIHFCIFH